MRRVVRLEAATKSAADEFSRAWPEMEAREKETLSRGERVRAQEAGLASRGCEFGVREGVAGVREEVAVVREVVWEAVAGSAAPEAGFLDRGEHLVEPMPDEES